MENVYVLRSRKDGKLYIGLTNNLDRRIDEHNSGKVPSTKGRRPLELVYFESYRDRKEASEKEKHFKSGKGRRELKDLLK
jgi:putative endonuclease